MYNKAEAHEYYLKNKERIRAYNKRWALQNRNYKNNWLKKYRNTDMGFLKRSLSILLQAFGCDRTELAQFIMELRRRNGNRNQMSLREKMDTQGRFSEDEEVRMWAE